MDHDRARTLPLVMPLTDVGAGDIGLVGGKNASLGEMLSTLSDQGVRVPEGFAVTSAAYWALLDANDLRPLIEQRLRMLDSDEGALRQVGAAIRSAITAAEVPEELRDAIVGSYAALCRRAGVGELPVAARSSATAEDLPEASFAGQHESFLNVVGPDAVVRAVRACMASLFTDRAISYRIAQGFDHMKVALSVGVQEMVRSDLGAAGVMFTLDTETGFTDVVQIDGAWGLGEAVVKGSVSPDRYTVFKPFLTDPALTPVIGRSLGSKTEKLVYGSGTNATERRLTDEAERGRFVLDRAEIVRLARWAVVIENHYGTPMDIEWAKDGLTDELFIVQARPETVQTMRDVDLLRSYVVTGAGALLAGGVAVGEGAAVGPVQRLASSQDIESFIPGSVLVTEVTDPDWVPIMRKAAAIVTDRGGRTSHAAIVSRELGIVAVIGTGDATEVLADGQVVTVSCAEGDVGYVYEGAADISVSEMHLSELPPTTTKVMLNLADPASSLRWWRLGADGVGLARMEFIISNHIKAHPMALAHLDEVRSAADRDRLRTLIKGYDGAIDYFVEKLACGIAGIAAPLYPNPVIVRLSDFKTNEYAALVGGTQFEPAEENPMLGWRGASRYYDDGYRDGFDLECRALRMVREQMGFTNVIVMIPFCRTLEEADKVLAVLAENGLERGCGGLEVYVMAEIPSNILLADQFSDRFDGFSIGSNDLTQLVLGIDRDSGRLADQFDEQNPAVLQMIRQLIETAHRRGRPVGLCGQAPSDHPEFAQLLVGMGIDSISVTPDSYATVRRAVAAAEADDVLEKDVQKTAATTATRTSGDIAE